MRLILSDDEGVVLDIWSTPDDSCLIGCLAEALPESSPTRQAIDRALAAIEETP